VFLKAILDVFGEEKIVLPQLGIEPQFLGCPCRSLVTILPTLSRLRIQGTGVILPATVGPPHLFTVYVPTFTSILSMSVTHNLNSARI